MSHSRKNNVENVLLLQQDLKNNYTRAQLKTLAAHYDISPLLNKEKLTMEIARANLPAKRRKAHMGNPHHKDINRQVLIAAEKDCSERLGTIQQMIEEKLHTLRNKRDEMYKALEEGLDIAPEAFNEILPQVLGGCKNELDQINDCLAKAVAETEAAAGKKLADIKEFLKKLKAPEEPAPPKPEPPGIPTKVPKAPPTPPTPPTLPPTPPTSIPPFVERPPTLPPTPPTSIPPFVGPPKKLPVKIPGPPTAPAQLEAEPPFPFPIKLPVKPPTAPAQLEAEPPFPLVGPPIKLPVKPPTAPALLEPEPEPPTIAPPTPPTPPTIPPPPPILPPTKEIWPYPSPPPTEEEECETDEDCEKKQAAGLLSGLHPTQKVICVTKRDGTHECVYQA